MLRLEAGTKEGLKHLNKNIFIIFKKRFNASRVFRISTMDK